MNSLRHLNGSENVHLTMKTTVMAQSLNKLGLPSLLCLV
ncbi:hypothetical protein BTN50_0383 [Candidatus Enterovibrio altilux]|uniref:Uncharacterized protein n=1 Tax=Candidatus Enterovibrio altilux TaxID=1927128 RepID=A0A291B7E5_9GAMM|nr:hypothetical protein BTN50_0383 [Candidatus Enterovibrio luxaltus]